MIKQATGFGVVVMLLASTVASAQPVSEPTSDKDTKAALELEIKAAMDTCIQCHGPGGVSNIPTRPTIAGQKSEYIENQLMAFRRSALTQQVSPTEEISLVRSDPVMEHMAIGLSEHVIVPLAQAVSQLACDGGVTKSELSKPRFGQRRPLAADACVGCHGLDGIGVWNHVPNLAGQQRAYLRRQLLLIRETAWGAQPRDGEAWRSHPIMEAKVARIRISDIDSIARYYASMDCHGGVKFNPESSSNN
ncbi:MAG: c-type cytochrome [Magnetovibrio sp.]|nr:c-type cytochrome [Magnetovibrio sp.]